MLPHLLLEQQAQRCIKLAYQCQNKNAERFLRLLAVDLMLAAQLRRPRDDADPLAELEKLSRDARAGSSSSSSSSNDITRMDAPLTSESASTA